MQLIRNYYVSNDFICDYYYGWLITRVENKNTNEFDRKEKKVKKVLSNINSRWYEQCNE